MRVTLFIGHHKVGSTALQSFLSGNARALLEHGVLYPAVEARGLRALEHGPAEDAPMSLNLREPHNGLAFRMLEEVGYMPVPPYHPGLPDSDTMLAGIATQIERHQPDHVVLCAEVFANFGRADTGLIDRLGRFLAGLDVTVMATLRRPDDYLVSWQGQRLKFGHALLPLSDGGLAQYVDDIHLDYRQMLRPWRQVFSRARWSVEDYARVRQDDGAVANFLRRAEIALPAALIAEPRANPSLHPGLHELVRRFNMELGRPEAAAMRRRLLEITPRADLAPAAHVEMFGPAARADMARLFAPSARWLAQLSDGDIVYTETELTRLRPVPERDAAARTLPAMLPHLTAAADGPLRDRIRRALDDTAEAGPANHGLPNERQGGNSS